MNEKSKKIIDQLDLERHPEGGYFRETYRSPHITATERGDRNLCTVIYYLLPAGEKSAKHRVMADELWVHQDGDDVLLTVYRENGPEKLILGKTGSPEAKPQILVPAGLWFSAQVNGASHALVTCIVSPGFTFQDFELAD